MGEERGEKPQAFLEKPYDPTKLKAATIERALEGAPLRERRAG